MRQFFAVISALCLLNTGVAFAGTETTAPDAAGVSISADATPALAVTDPLYWKAQAVNDLMPLWETTIDRENGGFFTDVEGDGSVVERGYKYPRMVSRVTFAFCAAYMMTGDEKYLDYAAHGMKYMEDMGWDKKYGGWYRQTDEYNQGDNYAKDLFDQTYGNLGPVFYYITTGDKKALELVSKTHALMREKAWDKKYGGYYAQVGENWEAYTDSKSFNSQIDTFTAYLLYYYQATKDPALLADIKALADVTVKRMVDPKTGFVGERFNREWKWTESELWAGHNLKTGWVLARAYLITGDRKYKAAAEKIAKAQMKYTWDAEYGGWFFKFMQKAPKSVDDSKDWWTQEEGNNLMLSMYKLTAEKKYLDTYLKSAMFWDKYFIDRENGECYSTLLRDGTVSNPAKANLYKSGYHSMEQALIAYLYLSLYVNKTDAVLYFRLSADTEGEKHYVNLLESKDVMIKAVEINGAAWDKFDAEAGFVILPAGKDMKVRVTLGNK